MSSIRKKDRHFFIWFIFQLNEKANKRNKYCICKLEIVAISFTNALQNKFLNKKERVITHLQKDPSGPPNNWQDNSEHNTKPSSSNFKDDMQSSITGDSRTSKTKKTKART
ncbi:13632_t:CDS:2 [Gigaspora margarita]|uniref:13632_t:CDS:1 n=1 Tax=Gigaspora margarita TaxID=4874 RepID=A0ABN7UW66_GIGMA|nr:13632_t:CDS:2 [Gigaspora margarita]